MDAPSLRDASLRMIARRWTRFALVAALLLLSVSVLAWWVWRQYHDAPAMTPVDVVSSLDQVEPDVRRLVQQQMRRIEASPESASSYGELGAIYEANGMWSDARQTYREAARRDPDRLVWKFHLALTMHQAGDADGALNVLKELTSDDPRHAPAQQRLGYALLDSGNLESAATAFQRVIDVLPEDAAGYVGRADVRLREDDPRQALLLLDQALRLDPRNRVAHYLRGSALRLLGKPDEATRELRIGETAKIVYLPDELSPRLDEYAVNTRARNKRGVRLMVERDFSGAVQILQAARQASPENITVLNNLAGAYVQMGRADEAEPLLSQALKLNPEKYTTYVNLASLNLNEGRLEAALAYAESAVQRAPWIPTTHRVRVMTLLQMKRYDDARSALADAERAIPGSSYWKQLGKQLHVRCGH